MEAALLGPIMGWMMDRFGTKNLMRIGTLFFGGGLMALSQIDSITGFYVAIILVAIGSNLGGYFPINVTVIQWFSRLRARALSTIALGLALGGFTLPILTWCMQTYGWRQTAFGSGIIAIIIGLPLCGVMRRRPEEHGLRVDGDPPPVVAAPMVDATGTLTAAVSEPLEREFTAREALHTKAFWLIACGHGAALLIVSSVNVHAVTHISHGLGYRLSQAAFVIMLMTASQMGGVLVGWLIGDRFEKRYIAAVCMGMHAFGLLMLTYAVHPIMLALFAIAHGGAWGLRGPFMQAIRADYFGRRAIGMIIGLSAFVTMFGQIGGPLIAGVFADLTGDYHLGFTILASIAACGSILFMLAKKPTLAPA